MSAPTITAPATASGGVPVGGSGAAGYLAKWTAATTLGGSSSTAGATASPFVDATGQIGIFTATPAEALTVAAGSNDRAGLSVASAVSTLLLGSKLATEGARQLEFDRSTGIFAIKYGNTGSSFTTGLAMDGSGNVGIGTASPASKLDVAGTITCDDAGTGIKLATAPANTDPSTLDCYREDSWTPTLSAAATWGGTQPTVSTARYVRIGSTVYCTVVLVGAPNFSSTYLSTTITAPFSASYNAVVPISSGATAFGCAQLNSGATTIFMPTFGVVGAATLSWTFIV